MLLNTVALVIFTGLTAVRAQSHLTTCAVQCINSGLTSVLCTYPDPLSCFCGNPAFPTNVEQCLQSSCTPPEQEAAIIALNSACLVGKSSGVYSFPPISSASTTTSSTATNSPLPMATTQPPSSSTSTSSSGSTTPGSAEVKVHLGFEGVVVGLVVLGTILGQALLR